MGGYSIVRLGLGGMLLVSTACSAMAAETPRYEAASAWIAPAPEAATTEDNPPLLQIIDQQTRIADGGTWSYHELATRALSADILARIGTISIGWQPFQGDLIVHRVDIIRGGQRIDILKAGQKFTVIRREEMLEQLQMDGKLTATLQVEGLRVGDTLDVAYSVTSKDPVLKGSVQTAAMAVTDPFKVGFARVRFLWPTGAPIKWKAYPIGIAVAQSDKGGWHELTFTLPAPKQPDLPADAPQRFRRPPLVEATSFADWSAVSTVTAPLYETTGLIAADSPLAVEVARINASESDPEKRAAAALALVQDRVRYFANAMNDGNYTPQAPAQTWSIGYGDCKAKTLLLLAILHELGIEAEAMVANIGLGDLVVERLPTLGAFNHIFVHAIIGGTDLWMDGTGRGSRLDDLRDPPPFHWVLPVRSSGAALTELPFRAPARPTRLVSLDIDASAGIDLPAPFEATVTLRGGYADSLRAAAAQMDKEKLTQLALLTLGGAAGPWAIPVTPKISFDAAAGTATVTVNGITPIAWRHQDHRYRYSPPSAISGLTLGGERARAAWKDIPVATAGPSHTLVTTRIQLPDDGRHLVLEGDQTLDLDVAGRRLVRKAVLAGGVLTIEDRATTSGVEMVAADMPPARAKLAAAQNRLLRLATNSDYPPLYAQIREAQRAHKLDRVTALYTTWIADKPDDVDRYLARAGFYQASFQWHEALADWDKAVGLDGKAANLLGRAALLERLGEKKKAVADYKAALTLEPESKRSIERLGLLEIDAGQKAAALETVDTHLATADEDKPDWLVIKAQLLARAHDTDAALAALDEAIATKPGIRPCSINVAGRRPRSMSSWIPPCRIARDR